MFIFDRLSINLLADEITPQIEAVQNDTGRGLLIDINANFENPQAFAYVDKADGHKVFNNCSISGSLITVEFSQQMLAAIGMNYLQIMIMDNSQRVTSFDIPVLVKKSRVDNSAIESTDEWGALEQLITQAQTAISGATTAAGIATEAANNANTATEAANIAAAHAESKAGAANTAANNAQQQADRASVAASGANVAADNAEAAAENANNAVAGLATSKHIFNIAGVTYSIGGTNANSTFAKKTGNVVSLSVTAIFNNAYALNADITELQNALNTLPLAWRKGLPYRMILIARIGTNMSCVNCRVNQTTYNFETVNTQLAFSAGTSISIVGSWVVDN